MRKKLALISLCVATTSLGSPLKASETITYAYDALGRLTQVNHSGSVNSGTQAGYTLDPAGNRTNVTITGATGGPRVIVVPLNGLTVIPIDAP